MVGLLGFASVLNYQVVMESEEEVDTGQHTVCCLRAVRQGANHSQELKTEAARRLSLIFWKW